ncbi:MAG: LLM class flavin-dependent oxidoreductase [bacterium]|nr:LLM class flavin-dependent oxidoreductase [bacterium]
MRLSWAFLDRPGLPEQLELVTLLDGLGYDTVYTVETRLVRDGVTVLGAFASRTSRIRLGLLSNSWTRDPDLMASTLASLDELAPGRVQVALSEYWDPLAANQGIVRRSPGTQIREYTQALRRLLSGDDRGFAGRMVRSSGGRLSSVPPAAPRIHLLGTGAMMAAAAGEVADGILLNGFLPPEGAASLLETAREGVASRNRRWDMFARPQIVNVAMDDNPEQALMAGRRLLARYVAHQPHIAAASGLPETTVNALRGIVGPWPGPPERVESALHLIDDGTVKRLMVAGTAGECREALGSWLDAGAGEVVVVPVTGDVAGMARALAPAGQGR